MADDGSDNRDKARGPRLVPARRASPELRDKDAVFRWICQNPGHDSEYIAEELGLDPVRASTLCEELLHEGRIEYAE